MNTALLTKLGVQYPIIQAPMAGVATPALAAAVSNAGALGSLGLGACNIEQAQQMIQETQQLTHRPFNVNFFCHQPAVRDVAREAAWLHYLAPLFARFNTVVPTQLREVYDTFLGNDAAVKMVLQLRPAVVSFHFGVPDAETIQAMRQAGITTLATATNLEEARQIEKVGIDAIVAQGIEAGGHRGMFDPAADDEKYSTAVLVQQLVRQQSLPVIAAGGIMDGAGIRAMLNLGAAAVQLGTAFILCPESAASLSYRQHIKSESAYHTQLTSVISGRPARGLVNTLMTFGEAGPVPADYPVAYDAAKQLHSAAVKQGDNGFAAHWVGQGAPLAREMPAKELVNVLMEELVKHD